MESFSTFDALRAFRLSLHACLRRRADALFELIDAILTAGAVPSPVHLSLQVVHRRGWGSLYAALRHGRIDQEALRDLLARHPLADEGANSDVRRFTSSTKASGLAATQRPAPSAVSTTTHPGIPLGNPSSPGGLTNWSPGLASAGTAGSLRWTRGE